MQLNLGLFKWPVILSAAGIAGAWVYGGAHAAGVVGMLIALEASVSFDNAVINASILRRLSHPWRLAFLTVGVILAVFVMRLVFPVAIVSIGTDRSLSQVVDQALHDQAAYARSVESAAPLIGAFGGIFLVLLALRFFFAPDRDRRWIRPIERLLSKVGRLPSAHVLVGGIALLVTAQLVSSAHQGTTLLAGLVGMMTFLGVDGFQDLMSGSGAANPRASLSGTAGFAGFLYLETIDASFSLDGVLGAFAISRDIVLISVGLGVGALFVRALTLYLVRREALRELPYLTHGAHWAIGVLGVFLLMSIEREPPTWLTGGTGFTILLAAWISSLMAGGRRQRSAADASNA